jgi:hypothetical protein
MKTKICFVVLYFLFMSLLAPGQGNDSFTGPGWPFYDEWDDILIDTVLNYNGGSASDITTTTAFDGMNYLIVSSLFIRNKEYLTGFRVNLEGEVISPGRFVISENVDANKAIAVAFGDSVFLVAWNYEDDIFGSVIDLYGNVLTPEGITISAREGSQKYPAVAFDGAKFLVCWIDQMEGNDVYGTFISEEGQILTPETIEITGTGDLSYPQNLLDLTVGPENYLAVWGNFKSGYTGICGARIDFSGEVLDKNGFEILGTQSEMLRLSVACDGNDFLVAGYRNSQIMYCRVTKEGTVLEPIGTVITEYQNVTEINLSYGADNYLLNWSYPDYYGEYHTMGTFIDLAGNVSDPDGFSMVTGNLRASQYNPCFNGIDFFMSYLSEPGIMANWLNLSGEIRLEEGIILTQYCNNQESPAIATDGKEFLVVWSDDRSETGLSVCGMRLDADGRPVDSQSFNLGHGSASCVKFNGSLYLVVWIRGDYILACRISSEGELLDTAPIIVAPSQGIDYHIGISSNQQEWMLVWADSFVGGGDIYACRISAAGEVIDPEGIRITTLSAATEPEIGFDGNNYMVTWTDLRSGLNGESDIYAARLTQQGVVLEMNGFKIQGQDEGIMINDRPALAFDGESYLIAYLSQNYDTLMIRGKLVSPEGEVLKSFVASSSHSLSADKIYFFDVRAFFDGSAFLVAWDPPGDIMGSRIISSGEVISTHKLVDLDRDQFDPCLARADDGSVILCYVGFTEYFQGWSVIANRIWSRPLDLSGNFNEPGSLSFLVYPNPTDGSIRINLEMKEESPLFISLFSLNGQELVSYKAGNLTYGTNEIRFDPGSISAGIYLLKLRTDQAEAFTKIIIVNKNRF